MNIYLVGYRGTGKSTVAPIIADKLGPGWAAVDMDALIEERTARSIASIFETDGEGAFRDWESAILEVLATSDRLVVSTGGGVILREINRQRLEEGLVVWLTASASTLLARIESDAATRLRRPNLTAVGGLVEVEELLAQRIPYYEMTADLTVSTEHETPDAIAARIADHARRKGIA